MHFEGENEGKMRNSCLQLVLHNNFLAAEKDLFGGRDAHRTFKGCETQNVIQKAAWMKPS